MSALLGGLSWAGLVFPDTPQDRLKWLAIWFVCFFLSAVWAFTAQAVKIRGIEERFIPRARLTYDSGDHTIFVQPGSVIVSGDAPLAGPYREFKHHVGIVNLSSETLIRLRFVLEEAIPHANHIIYRGRPMTVRGESSASSGYFDLPPSDGVRPSRYVEFLHELIPTAPVGDRRVGYRIPYALLSPEELTKLFFDRQKRTLVFRLEGGGLTQSLFFRTELFFDEASKRYHATTL